MDTGLLSTLACPKRELIAVTERLSPHTECYLHGNVPEGANPSPFAEQREIVAAQKVAEQRRPERRWADGGLSPNSRDGSFSLELKKYRTTRVDVDSKGRRSLVNEMR